LTAIEREFVFSPPEVRVAVREVPGLWPTVRRERHLLDPACASPLSVDKRVWPPAAASTDGVEVLCTAWAGDAAAVQRFLGEPNVELFDGDPAWTPVGYDVCDATLLSGLLNCGYAGADERIKALRWLPSLNQWHLFRASGDAALFAMATDERVPAHAPFHVFRLYLRA
jgi:hypothetical protein